MAMKDDAQMIILSAMVICLCLIGVMACAASVDPSYISSRQSVYISQDTVDNVQWAQDSCLSHAATVSSVYGWPERSKAVELFGLRSSPDTSGLSDCLLKHGVSYVFAFNESLAGAYLGTHPEPDAVNMGGVLVKPNSGSVKVYGCAYDACISDGTSTYRESRVTIF
jgi:hypothetical protein